MTTQTQTHSAPRFIDCAQALPRRCPMIFGGAHARPAPRATWELLGFSGERFAILRSPEWRTPNLDGVLPSQRYRLADGLAAGHGPMAMLDWKIAPETLQTLRAVARQVRATVQARWAARFDTTARFTIEGGETTIAELLQVNAHDAVVAAEIAPELRKLKVGQRWTYNGGAGGLFEYTRVR